MHYGANGDHFIMVFEILGVNLLEIMKRYDYRGIPMPLVRRISKQVLIGLDYLHRICKIIHTDLKPENTIVALSNDKLYDIVKTGQIRKTKKKAPAKLWADTDVKNFIPEGGRSGLESAAETEASSAPKPSLLEGIDTEGLTKQ